MTVSRSTKSSAKNRLVVERYLQRRQFYPFTVSAEASLHLGLVVVIPCFDEPDVGLVLESLASCAAPGCDVEVLVVINAPEDADSGTLERNHRSASCVRDHAAGRLPDWMRLYAIERNSLPVAQAGVGLARKIGMDEAAARLVAAAGNTRVIACLDADCRVAPNYLARLYETFVRRPDCPGVSIYFEHPEILDTDEPMHRAMIEYELHLRCYVTGQRKAGFPYAFHTVGSALACSAEAYVAQGGMNLRQGGEDFYFAQKLIAVGGYRPVNDTVVYPGVRQSARVPFGTGPALRRVLATGVELETFAPQIYDDLATFCKGVAQASPLSVSKLATGLPPVLRQFLNNHQFAERLDEICANVASTDSFRRRVFRWFNAFRFLKFAQHTTRGDYPKVPVSVAARALIGVDAPRTTPDLLRWYRRHDRDS